MGLAEAVAVQVLADALEDQADAALDLVMVKAAAREGAQSDGEPSCARAMPASS